MGLFGKLFDKKECAICGGEIGLLGNRKLADGNLCKNCAQKLSPWMTDRRESTVEEIRQHLNYREANAQIVPTLNPTQVFGTNTKVYLDEARQKFFVTRSSNWRDANPDVIDVSQVSDVRVDVREHKTELYRKNAEGKNERFNPPRYQYAYEFTVKILVNSPYFSEISFELTDHRPERRLNDAYQEFQRHGEALCAALMPNRFSAQAGGQNPVPQAAPTSPLQSFTRPQAAAAPAAQAAGWTCASCGALNQGKFCMSCGAKKPAGVRQLRCDKCGWQPEDPAHPPRFCPECGDPFDANDIV